MTSHRLGNVALVFVVSALVSTGCSSSTGGDDAGTPDTDVSFSKDVMPVLQLNCTASSLCHGSTGDAEVEGLYLGEFSDGTTIEPATAMAVYASLVGTKSLEDPSMGIVTAGKPDQSYLLFKVNGNQSTLASDCAKASLCPSVTCTTQMPCGTTMPYLGTPLTASELQPITDWITQGAKNN